MDVFKAVETYITKMVSTPSTIKVLLLDAHTVRLRRVIVAHRLRAQSFRVDSYRLTHLDAVDPIVLPNIPHGSYR